jgi:phosphoribosylformylglycinamidine cyclo-ligase
MWWLGLPSPNLRSNGFSLARRLFFDIAGVPLDDPAWDGADHSVADELLSPSVIYTPAVRAADRRGRGEGGRAHHRWRSARQPRARARRRDRCPYRSIARGNQPRVFRELQRIGDVDEREMLRVFNMGIGMVVVLLAG